MGLWWRKPEKRDSRDESMPLVRLQNVSKTFKGDADEDTVALAEVSVDVGRGEYVSVSGPSGCGKSTFLSVLALLETPTSGVYWLNGRRTDQLSPAERARVRSLDVGLVFQSFNLIGDMSVYENVEYPLTLRGASPAERASRVDAALERVGHDQPRQTAAGTALGRPPAARGHRARHCRPAADPARRRADRQPGFEDRRRADGRAVGAARRRRHRVLATHNPLYIERAERHIYLFDGRVMAEPVAG